MKRLCIVGMVALILIGSSYGQELAFSRKPKEPPRPKLILGDEFVWNMISIEFKVGVVNLVQKRGDTIGVPLGNVEITSPRVKALCDSLGAIMIEQTFKGKTPADTLSVSRTGEIVRVEDLSQCFTITFRDSMDVKGVAKLFNSLPEVKNASPVGIGHSIEHKDGDTKVQPNDEHYQNGDQWGLNGTYGINAPAAWDSSKGEGITIAIIDQGVDRLHNDLLTKMDGGETGYWNEHGTEVSGVAAAATNNVIGIAGVAWNSLIMTMNVGSVWIADWVAEDIEAAVDDGADVLNCSFMFSLDFPRLKQACRYAYQNNVPIIAGAGNDEFPIPYDQWPAAYDSFTIAVGAITKEGKRASWSNYGSWLDVMAPGDSIWTTEPVDAYGIVSGTSIATAFVTGIVALMLSAHPSYSPDKVKGKICDSCVDMGAAGWDDSTGYGRVKAPEAVGVKRQHPTLIPLSSSLFQNYPNPFNPVTTIAYDVSQDRPVNLTIYNSLGEEVATLVDKAQKAGHYSVQWDANNTASGIYFYRLRAGGFVKTKRMLLLK